MGAFYRQSPIKTALTYPLYKGKLLGDQGIKHSRDNIRHGIIEVHSYAILEIAVARPDDLRKDLKVLVLAEAPAYTERLTFGNRSLGLEHQAGTAEILSCCAEGRDTQHIGVHLGLLPDANRNGTAGFQTKRCSLTAIFVHPGLIQSFQAANRHGAGRRPALLPAIDCTEAYA